MFDNQSGYLTTDHDLAAREAILSELAEFGDLVERRPVKCTVFTFSRTDHSNRWATRIGGVPAWPTNTRWPICSACSEPLAFAAQLDFSSSPFAKDFDADVMTFHYCFVCCPFRPESGSALITWHKRTANDLIDECVIPDYLEDDEPGPFFGHPHAATDYAEEETAIYGYTLMGTKIGGYSPPIQPVVPPEDSLGRPMEFLACIGSIMAADVPKTRPSTACGDLIWSDMGCVSFWFGKNRKQLETTWHVASH